MSEITSTHDMAESEWDGESEPGDVPSDLVATTEPPDKGISFHVSMRDYTMRDMEALIIEAAAMQMVGRIGGSQLAKAIEAKCIDLIDAKATAALEKVTAEVIDQPITPRFGANEPVTMREFLGLYGREYLSARVEGSGKPYGGYNPSSASTRIEWLVCQYMDRAFKTQIEKATNAAITEVRDAIKKQHQSFLKAEMARFRDALNKTVDP